MHMTGRIRQFGGFWYDFIVGDDWHVALGVVIALAAMWGLREITTAPVWWVAPLAVTVLLPSSLYRALRRGR